MMKNKKILIILFVVIFLFMLIFYSFKINQKEKKEILLFNWGEYIKPQLIDDYNQKSEKFVVKQSFFSSNELAINKIQTGHQYDIAILSEYAIMQLKSDYLQKIETGIKNKIETNFNKKFKKIKKKMENDDYSIPYFWGKLVILYNKKKIKKQFLEKNWIDVFQNSKYKVALYNNPFEGIFLGLKATGGDISGSKEADNQKAKDWLLNLKKTNTNLSFVTDQLLDNMKIKDEEHYDLALAYSGDARFLMKNNDNLEFFDFYSDSGGTNIWVDSFVLPKGSNTEGAYDFINFLLETENIRKNTSFVGYDSPYIIPDYIDDKFKVNEKDKFYQYNEQCKKQINDIWNEVYASPRPKDYYLFVFSFLIFFVFISIRFFHLHFTKYFF